MNNKLILGMDLGERILTLTGSMENQIELKSGSFVLSVEKKAREIIGYIKEFVKENFGDKPVDMLLYSTENLPFSKCKALENMMRSAGFGREGIRLISRENAFAHYVLNQDKDLHLHTVLAFEHTGQELWGYRIYYPNKKIDKEMKTERHFIGPFHLAGESVTMGRMMDKKFADVAKQILSKEVVSAVYLTGQGFDGNWLSKSLSILCDGRRAFFDHNLFAAGCLYYGVNNSQDKKSEYLIHAPETVLYECGVVDSGNKDAFVKITEAGYAWYETKGSMDIIMERGGRMDIVFSHANTQEKQVESVDLSELSGRPRKTGRMEITVEFTDSHEGVILVRDKGFGQFVPNTYQVFIKEFKLL